MTVLRNDRLCRYLESIVLQAALPRKVREITNDSVRQFAIYYYCPIQKMQTRHAQQDAICAELLVEWFGTGIRASGDGPALNLDGAGEADQVNDHYGRDAILVLPIRDAPLSR